MISPDLDHGEGGLEALVENADGTIAVSADEDIAGNLVRG